MPTGYTAAVQNGEITTLPQFAMRCARNFGALIDMRDAPADAPIPARFEISSYYIDCVERDRKALEVLANLSPSEAQRMCQQEHSEALARWRERTDTRGIQRARYKAMLAQVDAHGPPSPSHAGLWDFMGKQLTDSMEWDCEGIPLPMPVIKRWPIWLQDRTLSAMQDVARSVKYLAEEMQRVESRNAWVQGLREEFQ